MNNEWYQGVAQQARNNVRVKYGHSPMLRNVHYRKDYWSLRRHCADVSHEVVEILNRNKISSKVIPIISPRGGGTHIVVYVPKDDVIIDGTINQYMKGNYRYVYSKGNYPLK